MLCSSSSAALGRNRILSLCEHREHGLKMSPEPPARVGSQNSFWANYPFNTQPGPVTIRFGNILHISHHRKCQMKTCWLNGNKSVTVWLHPEETFRQRAKKLSAQPDTPHQRRWNSLQLYDELRLRLVGGCEHGPPTMRHGGPHDLLGES